MQQIKHINNSSTEELCRNLYDHFIEKGRIVLWVNRRRCIDPAPTGPVIAITEALKESRMNRTESKKHRYGDQFFITTSGTKVYITNEIFKTVCKRLEQENLIDSRYQTVPFFAIIDRDTDTALMPYSAKTIYQEPTKNSSFLIETDGIEFGIDTTKATRPEKPKTNGKIKSLADTSMEDLLIAAATTFHKNNKLIIYTNIARAAHPPENASTILLTRELRETLLKEVIPRHTGPETKFFIDLEGTACYIDEKCMRALCYWINDNYKDQTSHIENYASIVDKDTNVELIPWDLETRACAPSETDDLFARRLLTLELSVIPK